MFSKEGSDKLRELSLDYSPYLNFFYSLLITNAYFFCFDFPKLQWNKSQYVWEYGWILESP